MRACHAILITLLLAFHLFVVSTSPPSICALLLSFLQIIERCYMRGQDCCWCFLLFSVLQNTLPPCPFSSSFSVSQSVTPPGVFAMQLLIQSSGKFVVLEKVKAEMRKRRMMMMMRRRRRRRKMRRITRPGLFPFLVLLPLSLKLRMSLTSPAWVSVETCLLFVRKHFLYSRFLPRFRFSILSFSLFFSLFSCLFSLVVFSPLFLCSLTLLLFFCRCFGFSFFVAMLLLLSFSVSFFELVITSFTSRRSQSHHLFTMDQCLRYFTRLLRLSLVFLRANWWFSSFHSTSSCNWSIFFIW